jgi:hypothetical protein
VPHGAALIYRAFAGKPVKIIATAIMLNSTNLE